MRLVVAHGCKQIVYGYIVIDKMDIVHNVLNAYARILIARAQEFSYLHHAYGVAFRINNGQS